LPAFGFGWHPGDRRTICVRNPFPFGAPSRVYFGLGPPLVNLGLKVKGN